MLRFRRKTAEKPAPTDEGPKGNAPVDRAQALLALLGDDARKMGLGGAAGAAPDISQERLRLMARDLIAQVEGRALRAKTSTSPVIKPVADEALPQVGPTPRRQVFSSASPLSAPSKPEPFVGQEVLSNLLPAPESLAGRGDRTHRASSMPTPMAQPRTPSPVAATLSAPDVRRLVAEGYDPAAAGREHPAIVALTLEGQPPLQQAAALRQLPRGQVRGVHRALRLLEMRGA